MAYQNCGTPRFYVDILQWLKSQGLISLHQRTFTEGSSFIMDLIGINPTSIIELSGGNGDNDTIRFNTTSPLRILMPNDKNFTMALGHNFASAEASFFTSEGEGTAEAGGTEQTWTSVATTGYVNSTSVGSSGNIDYDGFSIHIGNDAQDIQTNKLQFRFDYQGDGNAYNDNPLKIGSLLYGTYYDMSHSPDLSLKLSYDYDGVKTQQTKGGATLSNALYSKPADWGDMGCWQLQDPNSNTQTSQNYRTGRRVWDLSFSFLSSSDIMPSNAIINNLYSASYYSSNTLIDDFGYTSDDVQTADTNNGAFRENILTSEDFFSQVWNKTMGGHLPFIFQPDNNLNLPDQLAICRFDMDSLELTRTAVNIYNMKLKIREVW